MQLTCKFQSIFILRSTHREFNFGHSQSGIGWEFAKFMQSGWESTKKCIVQENDPRNNWCGSPAEEIKCEDL